MRRVILEEPLSRSALWSRNLALFALVVAMIGILLSHKGLDATASLSIESGALAVAALAALFALVAMAVIWHTGYRGILLAVQGLAIAALLFLYPAYLYSTHRVPTLLDASTSPDDPPPFLDARAARHGYAPPERPGAADRALQAKLDPDLQSLDLDADVGDVEIALHKLIKRRKWAIIGEVPAKNYATGRVDMVAKSGLLGFPADVTVRLRGIGARTRVDIRSVSRSPWQEQPSANADRVQALSDDLEDAIGEG